MFSAVAAALAEFGYHILIVEPGLDHSKRLAGELIHPPGVSWERGLIFRTHEERGEAVWVVTTLDRDLHAVEYYRVEAGRYVGHVEVRCTDSAGSRTDVRVTYTFVGLSDVGNQDIAAMSPRAYEEKMRRWQGWITKHLSG